MHKFAKRWRDENNIAEERHNPTYKGEQKGKNLQYSNVERHLAIVVFLVLYFAKLEQPIEQIWRSHWSFTHNTAVTAIADIQNHADDLLCHVQWAASSHNMLAFKFERSRILIQFKTSLILASCVVLPFYLTWEKLHELRVTQARPCFVLSVLTRLFGITLSVDHTWTALYVTQLLSRVIVASAFDVQYKAISRQLLIIFDFNDVANH